MASGGFDVAGIARPRPLFGPGDQAGAYRIEVQIATNGPVVGFVLDHLGFVSSLEQVSGSASPPCAVKCVGREERLHSAGEVGSWGFEQEMEMVGHENVGGEFPS